jgi:hypothetical protein
MGTTKPYIDISTMRHCFVLAVSLVLAVSWPLIAIAQSGKGEGSKIVEVQKQKLKIEIHDAITDIGVPGVQIRCIGQDEFSQPSSSNGVIELPLPADVVPVPGTSIDIDLHPNNKGSYKIISPADQFVVVPDPKMKRVSKVLLMEIEVYNAMKTRQPVTRSQNTQRNVNVEKFEGIAVQLDNRP